MKKAFSIFIIAVLVTLQASGLLVFGFPSSIFDEQGAAPRVSVSQLRGFSSILVIINTSLADQMLRLIELSGAVGSLADTRPSPAPAKSEANSGGAISFAMPTVGADFARMTASHTIFDSFISNSSAAQAVLLIMLAILLWGFTVHKTLMLRHMLFLPRAGIEYSITSQIMNIAKIPSLSQMQWGNFFGLITNYNESISEANYAS